LIPNVNHLPAHAVTCPCQKRGASLMLELGGRRFWICMPCGARAMEDATWANIRFSAVPIAELIARPHQGSC